MSCVDTPACSTQGVACQRGDRERMVMSDDCVEKQTIAGFICIDDMCIFSLSQNSAIRSCEELLTV